MAAIGGIGNQAGNGGVGGALAEPDGQVGIDADRSGGGGGSAGHVLVVAGAEPGGTTSPAIHFITITPID